jgi:hypothetical protein
MSGALSPKVVGGVLLGAALVGGVVIAFFPSGLTRPAAVPKVATPSAAADTQWTTMRVSNLDEAVDRLAPAAGALPLPPPRIEIPSPLDSAATDSAPATCVLRVKQTLSEAARDSSGVEVSRITGVRPEPGRGPDSLVIDGTAHGRDATPAVWHCAMVAGRDSGIAKLTAVIEDGWPGVPSEFGTAHAVTLLAENACLNQMQMILREYEYRGIKRWRNADTLHVTGEAMPLNTEDLAADFHCRAIVRNGSVVSTQAKAGR